MEFDNGIRGKCGVAISALELEDNKIRILMDDITNSAGETPEPWQHKGVVTWKEYDIEEFLKLELTEKELSGFGFYVFNRLAALLKTPYSA